MSPLATSDLEQWLCDSSRHLIAGGLGAHSAVTERLRFVARLLAELETCVVSPALVFRPPGRRAIAAPICGELTVGRVAPAQLALDDGRLSRSHFTIQHSPAGHVLEDANSRNGTYVNGTRVNSCLLRDGNIIEAGAQVFVFLDQLAAL